MLGVSVYQCGRLGPKGEKPRSSAGAVDAGLVQIRCFDQTSRCLVAIQFVEPGVAEAVRPVGAIWGIAGGLDEVLREVSRCGP